MFFCQYWVLSCCCKEFHCLTIPQLLVDICLVFTFGLYASFPFLSPGYILRNGIPGK